MFCSFVSLHTTWCGMLTSWALGL